MNKDIINDILCYLKSGCRLLRICYSNSKFVTGWLEGRAVSEDAAREHGRGRDQGTHKVCEKRRSSGHPEDCWLQR